MLTEPVGHYGDWSIFRCIFRGTIIWHQDYYPLLYEIKIIQSIKQIFKKERSSDSWNELTSEQQTEIKQPFEEINQGKVTD